STPNSLPAGSVAHSLRARGGPTRGASGLHPPGSIRGGWRTPRLPVKERGGVEGRFPNVGARCKRAPTFGNDFLAALSPSPSPATRGATGPVPLPVEVPRAHQPLRVGLVGAGANTRARHIPGLKALSEVEIAAVCNRRPASTRAVAQEYGVPRTFEHWQDLVA